MLLTIDAGNTNVVFALFAEDNPLAAPVAEWRVGTDPARTAEEYIGWLTHQMGVREVSPADITGAAIASVVPAATPALGALCRELLGADPVIVGDGADIGIEIKVDAPDEVGADRLVNAVAAIAHYAPPLIIIDFGTATTFDVVDSSGAYAGGIIAPGIHLSAEALHAAAAKLPRISIERPDKVIGTGTITAMQSGLYWGYVSMIEGMVDRIRDEFGAAMTVIGTGGLAPLFLEATDRIEHSDPDLTSRGLVDIYRRNKGS